jgi:hypothetical protein
MLTEEQIAIYRRMSPAEKLKAAFDLWVTARELKAAALRADHPDWNEKQIQAKVAEIFKFART